MPVDSAYCAGLQIPYNQFKWSFTKVYADNDDGTKSPAIWVKGYCTILTVLQALTSANGGQGLLSQPFEPAQSDSGYYYTNGNRINGLKDRQDELMNELIH